MGINVNIRNSAVRTGSQMIESQMGTDTNNIDEENRVDDIGPAGKINVKRHLKLNVKKKRNKERLKKIEKTKKLKELTKAAMVAAKAIVTSKIGIIVIAVLFFLFILISAISSVPSAMMATQSSTPTLTDSQVTKLKAYMDMLDQDASKKLKSGFRITGKKSLDWRSVLSITVALYNNDLTELEKEIIETGAGGNWTGTYSELINNASKKHNVSPYLISAIIKQESGFNSSVVSPVGAIGLMQLMPATAQWLGCLNPYDPVQNVDAGTKYIRMMLDKYSNDLTLALAAYNAGPGNVDKYGVVPPFAETQNYVIKVSGFYNAYANGAIDLDDVVISGNGGVIGNNHLTKTYYALNEIVSPTELKRNSFEDTIKKMKLTTEQEEMAVAFYEADLWEYIFPNGTNFKFNISGKYVEGVDSSLTGTRKNIIELAQRYLGVEYVYGAKVPGHMEPTAWDCSGFLAWIYQRATGYAGLQAGGTWTQQALSTKITEAEARPGDIAFNLDCTHVLIYAGKKNGVNYYYHAANERLGTIYSTYSEPVEFYRINGVEFKD